MLWGSLAVAASLVQAVDAPGAIRVPVVLAFLILAPGAALLELFRPRDLAAWASLSIGVSLAIDMGVAQGMVWLKTWNPAAGLYLVAGITVLAALARLLQGDSTPDDGGR